MTADYDCPYCEKTLVDGTVANAHRCSECGALVLEPIDESHQRVREFYRLVVEGM